MNVKKKILYNLSVASSTLLDTEYKESCFRYIWDLKTRFHIGGFSDRLFHMNTEEADLQRCV